MKYKILHIDIGRKYFNLEQLIRLTDIASENHYNQLQLYFSDNQGFRFMLDGMKVFAGSREYDLKCALGDGYIDETMYMRPDGSGKYLTQDEMTSLINYAAAKGLDVVPAFNVPSHMGALLMHFPQFKYETRKGKSAQTIDFTNETAREFALNTLNLYIRYFSQAGCRFFNILADEVASDVGGYDEIIGLGHYEDLISFIKQGTEMIHRAGMTARLFNDSLYLVEGEKYALTSDIEVCSCFDCGNRTSVIKEKGHRIINGPIRDFWVLGKSDWQVSAERALADDLHLFTDSTVLEEVDGAMMCIWCDVGDAETGDECIANMTEAIKAFGCNASVGR